MSITEHNPSVLEQQFPGGFPHPKDGVVVTLLLIVSDQERSRDFYERVMGGQVVRERNPLMVRLHNIWLMLNTGGPPTPDKPTITCAPPRDPSTLSVALNLRVSDFEAAVAEYKARGATLLAPPVDWPHERRCYLQDPDGYIVEIGEFTKLNF